MATDSQDSTVLLYDHPVSSYTQKIRIALREKNVPFKSVIPEGLGSGRYKADFKDANPRVEVPALVHEGVGIFDSSVIMQYIEDRWTDKPLLPATPAAKAVARMIEDVCDTQYEAVNWGWAEFFWNKRATGESAEPFKVIAMKQTRILQRWLTEHLGKGPYFNGDTFGWADISVAPFVNRSVYWGPGFAPEADSPLGLWRERILERPSVAQTFEEFDAGASRMSEAAEPYLSGERVRQYRDHRLEWMIKSGGIDIVLAGLKKGNIRFSWPDIEFSKYTD